MWKRNWTCNAIRFAPSRPYSILHGLGADRVAAQLNLMEQVADRVPATVLTGFLGSGKTTLLNHILTATHGKKIAIIENEFGDVSIDDALVAKNSKFHSDEEIIEVLNGCICCSVRGDLVAILEKLASRCKAGELHLDAIIIETTGMADPTPVAQCFFMDESIRSFTRLDGIITMVDAQHVERHLDAVKPEGTINEACAQLGFADRVLLTKVDLVSNLGALPLIVGCSQSDHKSRQSRASPPLTEKSLTLSKKSKINEITVVIYFDSVNSGVDLAADRRAIAPPPHRLHTGQFIRLKPQYCIV